MLRAGPLSQSLLRLSLQSSPSSLAPFGSRLFTAARPSLYEVLNVRRGASRKEIKASFVALMQTKGGSASAEERAVLEDAYRTLSVGVSRKAYDAQLGREPRFARANVDALQLYQSKFGFLHLPRNYCLPTTSPDGSIPDSLLGFPLEKESRRWRTQARLGILHPADVLRLDAMGFEWVHITASWLLRKSQLAIYKKLHGVVMVPGKFVVPADTPSWPAPYWGAKLGLAVNNMRRKKQRRFRPFWSELQDLEFDFAAQIDRRSFDTVVAALRVFKARPEFARYRGDDGSLHVPSRFVVPGDGGEDGAAGLGSGSGSGAQVDSDTGSTSSRSRAGPPWPKETWGLRLGKVVHNMHHQNTFADDERRAVLEEIGIRRRLLPGGPGRGGGGGGGGGEDGSDSDSDSDSDSSSDSEDSGDGDDKDEDEGEHKDDEKDRDKDKERDKEDNEDEDEEDEERRRR